MIEFYNLLTYIYQLLDSMFAYLTIMKLFTYIQTYERASIGEISGFIYY